MGDALASHYGGSGTTTAVKTPSSSSGATSAMGSALSSYYKANPAPVSQPISTPTVQSQPQVGPVRSFFNGVGSDIGSAASGVGNFFKSFVSPPPKQNDLVFNVAQPGTDPNLHLQIPAITKEEQLGAQTVPQTPTNMDVGQGL